MIPIIQDDTLNLEQHEIFLQNKKSNLTKAMRHWQLWEAEYEGLKEEILAAESLPTRAELVHICSQYEGDLVSKKEINDILGTTTPRDSAQVINVLDRRVDYVEQNVRSLQKQIEAVEKKLEALDVINTTEIRDDAGLPLTEINEELDENDNIISSRISTPGTSNSKIGEILQKSGIGEELIPTVPQARPADFNKNRDTVSETKSSSATSIKRSMSFAEDTKPGSDLEKSETAKRLENIMKIARQQEELSHEPPIIPENESAEDAALRREMLQYGMSEIGAVVAELELEEDEGRWSNDDFQDSNSDSDEEDSYGRYTGQIITDDLRKQMIELEQRLGANSTNKGKPANEYDVVDEGIGRISIRDGRDEVVRNEKIVRFAERLDIAPDSSSISTEVRETAAKSRSAPISDIVERKTSVNDAYSVDLRGEPIPEPSSSTGFEPHNQRRTIPEGPPGIPLAETIIERDLPNNLSTIEPDEMDSHLLQQEIAIEYHKMRNLMIQRQGGFMKESDSERVELTEDEGGPKKISRFKAARLARP